MPRVRPCVTAGVTLIEHMRPTSVNVVELRRTLRGFIAKNRLPHERVLNFEEIYSYRNVYSANVLASQVGRNLLKTLVGAGRFERPTPCAQGRFHSLPQIAYFQLLLFQ